MKKVYHSNCFVCASEQLLEMKRYQKHGLVKCINCGFVFAKQIPSTEELEDWYSNYSYNEEEYLSPVTVLSYNKLLDEFEKYRSNNKLLDVGCGRGAFLQVAKKRGWEVYGTEYSAKAINICEQKGINMKAGILNPKDFEGVNFDIITSFEVIEHINYPHRELQSINLLLRSGGLFYCTTPNFNSLLRFYLKENYNVIGYPEHLSYYTKSTLNKVVLKNNFKLIKFLSTGISITRIKGSTGSTTEKLNSPDSSDEILRKKIESKWYLAIAKQVINFILTLTNTGISLKGYYIKK
jgi:2-polyprenyl-3-methyl-5-hydroxy-6-metoxy-1,4-benzoquinol methylase